MMITRKHQKPSCKMRNQIYTNDMMQQTLWRVSLKFGCLAWLRSWRDHRTMEKLYYHHYFRCYHVDRSVRIGCRGRKRSLKETDILQRFQMTQEDSMKIVNVYGKSNSFDESAIGFSALVTLFFSVDCCEQGRTSTHQTCSIRGYNQHKLGVWLSGCLTRNQRSRDSQDGCESHCFKKRKWVASDQFSRISANAWVIRQTISRTLHESTSLCYKISWKLWRPSGLMTSSRGRDYSNDLVSKGDEIVQGRGTEGLLFSFTGDWSLERSSFWNPVYENGEPRTIDERTERANGQLERLRDWLLFSRSIGVRADVGRPTKLARGSAIEKWCWFRGICNLGGWRIGQSQDLQGNRNLLWVDALHVIWLVVVWVCTAVSKVVLARIDEVFILKSSILIPEASFDLTFRQCRERGNLRWCAWANEISRRKWALHDNYEPVSWFSGITIVSLRGKSMENWVNFRIESFATGEGLRIVLDK